jgi:hypothetical protein
LVTENGVRGDAYATPFDRRALRKVRRRPTFRYPLLDGPLTRRCPFCLLRAFRENVCKPERVGDISVIQ